MLKIRFDKDKALYYAMFFLMVIKYLFPSFIMQMIESNYYVDLLITLISIGLMALFIALKYRVVIHSICIIIVTYLWLIITTVMNGGNVYPAFVHGVQVILLCLLMDTIIDNERMLDSFLHVVRDITLFFYIVNIFVMILLPDGIPSISAGQRYPWYLYGNLNTPIKYVLPGLCCSLIIDCKKNKVMSIPSFIMISGIIVTAFTVYFTATAVIADVIIILWLLGYKWLKKRPWKIYAIAYLVIFIFEMVIVLESDKLNLLSYISSFFGKSTTLSGRTPLWARAYEGFLKKPICGHGFQTFYELEKILGNGYGSHNYYLDMLYQRGIIGLALTLILLVVPVIRGWRKGECSKPMYLLIGICIACSVMLLMEPFYDSESLFIPMYYILFSAFPRKNARTHIKRIGGRRKYGQQIS